MARACNYLSPGCSWRCFDRGYYVLEFIPGLRELATDLILFPTSWLVYYLTGDRHFTQHNDR
jgi:hypothetical protein